MSSEMNLHSSDASLLERLQLWAPLILLTVSACEGAVVKSVVK
jgi:hypothetical protein